MALAVAAGVTLWLILGRPDRAGGFELIKIALAVPAGVGGVVALVVASRKQHLNEADHKRQEEAARRENTKLYNERFGRAADQLSSDKSAARLAGVYAMAGLADDWEEGRQTCIDVLCAYLRMPYPSTSDGENGNEQAVHEERLVRHTIIGIIGSHLKPDASVSWQGRNFNFTGAVFDGGSLDEAVFSGGEVRFDYVTFAGDSFRLIGAEFALGRVSFHGAKFVEGEVAFVGAKFTGGIVDFSFSQLDGGFINFIASEFKAGGVDFTLAEFSKGEAAFAGAKFSGARVSFSGAKFSGAVVGFGRALADGETFTRGAVFAGGDITFKKAEFSGGKVDFVGAVFSGGKVSLEQPGVYEVPPRFDKWKAGPPASLLLPSPPAS